MTTLVVPVVAIVRNILNQFGQYAPLVGDVTASRHQKVIIRLREQYKAIRLILAEDGIW